MSDLFDANAPHLTPAERKRLYRAGARASAKPKGLFAAPPGSGPKGETCKSCKHLCRKRMSKVYLKCGLMQQHWTGGGGTDVRASTPACRKWERA